MKKILYTLIFLKLIFLADLNASNKETEIINLGSAINSEKNELNPVITPDGTTLYFCRENKNNKQDIYFSTKDRQGNWSRAQKMPAPLNNDNNNFVFAVANGGNSLLLANIYLKDGRVRKGVSISHKTRNGWSFPEPLNINNYYNWNDFAGFYLGSDGKTLLMTIERVESKGKRDLYVSFKQEDNTWSTPMNMGEEINSELNESSPFLAADGKTLYFASEGHDNFGSADIFISHRLDSTWQNWSKPENLGKGINSEEWDAYYKTSAESDFAYCVSNKNTDGNLDIYSYKIPEQHKSQPVVLLKGKIRSCKSLLPIEADLSFTQSNSTNNLISKSEPLNGNYTISLSMKESYELSISSLGYKVLNDDLNIQNKNEYVEITNDYDLVPEADSLICIQNILFNSGKTTPHKSYYKEIQKLVSFLNENENCNVVIRGYTDNTGTYKLNKEIAFSRANSVFEILKENGIHENRVNIIPLPMKDYLTDNSSKKMKAYNRRVEIQVYEAEQYQALKD